MSPTPELWVRDIPSNSTAYVTKPTDVDALILEAWAEGYMVGSLIIMSCITLANMRRGVLLHKLILLEVGLGTHLLYVLLINVYPAGPRILARIFHLLPSAHLRLVAFSGSHPPKHVVVFTQRYCLDQDQAIPLETSQLHLYWHRHPGTTILGSRDLRQFHLLPQRQSGLLENKTVGSTVSRSLVACHDHLPLLHHQDEV